MLCAQPYRPVEVSPLLFRAIEFAVAVAGATDGAFDPTIGAAMVRRGFNRNYRTGEISEGTTAEGSYRDLVLDAARGAVMMRRRLLLDLGAVAKGLAIDLAAAELESLQGFLINAGGDLRFHGLSPEGEAWRIGVNDPNQPGSLLDVLELTDGAVCTSGGYERPASDGGHHILAADGRSPDDVTGVTVLAPSAMVADALSTAAFVLGVERGMALLENEGVEGSIVTSKGLVVSTGKLVGARS
jgi:thiamine biosynthesis lipoprotein